MARITSRKRKTIRCQLSAKQKQIPILISNKNKNERPVEYGIFRPCMDLEQKHSQDYLNKFKFHQN